jgi:MutS domain V
VSRDAADEYRSRLAARTATRETLSAADARFANGRLATVGLTVLLAIVAWRADVSFWWLIVPAAAFAWLARRHDRVLRERTAAVRGIAFYERGLARLADRWTGTGETGERFRDDHHVYANDLDLFGRGSLFELLSLARTRTGEERLARWLTRSADADEIRARQEAVAELAPALDLREQLTLAGADVRMGVQTDRLVEWAESPLPPQRELFAFTWLFTAAAILTIPLAALTAVWWPLGLVVGLEALVFRRLRGTIYAILSGRDTNTTADFVADALTHRALDLDVVADLLKNLERQRFGSGRLSHLHERLTSRGVPASRSIRRLHRLCEIHDSERNTLIVPVGFFLLGQLEFALSLGAVLQLVRPHVALAVERWRRRHGREVRVWLEIIAEFEALTSLAGYRFEHSDDPFPEISTAVDGMRTRAAFDGVQLGHPLLPAAATVRNDVRLTDGTQLLVVSGSNMSGKSTLLRTVGINAVLALAGAPVRAASLRLSPLAIGATLRIQDSLQEGRSRFYAEITRIRELSDVANGPVPLLFLLDELFHGTNSHDRVVGAAGVLRSLLDRGAIGLITTHDLALTAVAGELSARAANVHFQDWFEGNEIRFDYLMKPGPVARSNAIALMRAVGLDVP